MLSLALINSIKYSNFQTLSIELVCYYGMHMYLKSQIKSLCRALSLKFDSTDVWSEVISKPLLIQPRLVLKATANVYVTVAPPLPPPMGSGP